jgi:hypothetical protein
LHTSKQDASSTQGSNPFRFNALRKFNRRWIVRAAFQLGAASRFGTALTQRQRPTIGALAWLSRRGD